MRCYTAIALLVLAAGACSAPLEFDDWTIPVPEGARIIEHAHVPIEERTDRIELVEDLVVGGGSGDPRYEFYQAFRVAVDARGFMYVMDRGNHRIQVFDENGEYVRTLGSEGQGPGEIQDPRLVTVAGDTVVLTDTANGRINHWSALNGEFLGSVPLQERSLEAYGLADGAMAGRFVVFHREPEAFREGAFARLAIDGTELRRLTIFRLHPSSSIAVPYARELMAVSPAGDVYITKSDRYQILAFDGDGEPRWALRTSWLVPEVPQEIHDNALKRLRERDPDYDRNTDWLEHMPAIGNIMVDGRGNLYVLSYVYVPRDPYTGESLADGPDEIGVDVFSPDGERLSAALMAPGYWTAARGDYVYSMGRDPDSEEEVLRRYRLVVPWEQ